jgi:transcriptional regulator with XRE-family HTH domain
VAISPAQSLAARGLLNLSQVRLARLANISRSMLRDFEKGRRTPTIDDLEAIRRALEAKGVEFTSGEPGVRLKKADRVTRATWDPPPKG